MPWHLRYCSVCDRVTRQEFVRKRTWKCLRCGKTLENSKYRKRQKVVDA